MSDRSRLEQRVARAVARAAVSGRPSIVTLAAPAKERDALAVALEAGPPLAYWELPDRGFAMAASGEAHTIRTPADAKRFGTASAAIRDLASRTHQAAFGGAERAPLLIGGFSFSPSGAWPEFPAGRLVLPEIAYIQRDPGNRVWMAATEVLAGADPAAVAGTLLGRIRSARHTAPARVTPRVTDNRRAEDIDLSDPGYLAGALEAIRLIRDGDLTKVTLARRLDVDHRPDLGPFLAALRQIYGTCAVFAFGRPEGAVFCGVTPELLARVEGLTVKALALAGTAPRGSSRSEDQRLAHLLLNDSKELEEHAYVRSELMRRLSDRGFALDPPERTGILELPGILHLATPISAVAPVGTGVLDVVGSLHPTPAVGGLPRDRATSWITAHEPFDRGWYAGPVGYCDLTGNGEFHAALRSCLIEGNRTSLFAGAGIVSASQPEKELLETDLKLGALLPSLSGMTDHRWRTYATADTLATALGEGGVAEVIVSPGSRSTPLALAVRDEGPPSKVVLDERSAGFTALGLARATGKPAAVVCTSGSAAANYLPAVVEADRGRVPLVVITADRPPGFLDRDAPQTINQVGLYGSAVRASAYLPVAHECDPEWVIGEVLRLLEAASTPNAGPVHLNVPFDKPLEPPARRDTKPSFEMPLPESRGERVLGASVETLEGFMDRAASGVIVVGPRGTGRTERDAVHRLAALSGWPILADGMSGLRSRDGENLVTTGDMLVGDRSFVTRHTPDAILRIGGTPTGTVTQNWLEGLRAPEIVLDPDFRWTAAGPKAVLRDPIAPLLERVSPSRLDGRWTRAWRSADLRVRGRRRYERIHHPDTELALTAEVLDSEALVWAGSSMPVRHVNAMMEPGCRAAVFGNRGACGIDGALASATGAALGLGRRVTALLGDLTFLHDVGSLATARALGVDLSVMVLDNGGGAIFEMLPYLRSLRESGAEDAYAQGRELFVTPHDQDLVAVAGGFGVTAERIEPGEMAGALRRARSRPGVSVLVAKTDSEAMFAAYDRLYRT